MNNQTQAERQDFFQKFMHFTLGTEVPTFFYRWAAIAGLGAWIGRDVYVQFGAQKIYPNMYVLLMGEPGTKKSTAIKRMKKLLKEAGYANFAAEKTSKEKFLLDMGNEEEETDGEEFLNSGLFGNDEVREVFIAADEFNDFFGNNILDFVSMLGVLWDFDGIYENKIKNGQSVRIPYPTVSILGGTTATTFAHTFPQEVIGQGFFSRTLAVHAKPTGKRITWPPEEDEVQKADLLEYLLKVKTCHSGRLEFSEEALALVDKIYQTWENIEDIRFASYANRRLVHLLKMILVHTIGRLGTQVEKEDVIYANTVLYHTERHMPQAYGEFGQSKNSLLTHKILQILEASSDALEIHELWSKVQSDFDRMEPFSQLLQGMSHAGKIQVHSGKILPKKQVMKAEYSEVVDYSYLTAEEIN